MGNVTTYSVTGLACNTTYYYRLRSGNSCGSTANTNTISVTTGSCCVTFNYTGSVQTWTVPAVVTSITIDVQGAAGGDATACYAMSGGYGARVTGSISVTPGQVLQIYVGGKGQDATNSGCSGGSPGAGGWNGGGDGGNNAYPGAGGGGASDIRIAPYGLADRLVVAGGGGGAGIGSFGCSAPHYAGAGGCNSGGVGTDLNSCYPNTGEKGDGGTQISGGAGGGTTTGNPGMSGALGVGGNGGSGCTGSPCDSGGGGGGGGFYGGGGAGSGYWSEGGGGGSSYVPTGCTCTMGYQAGNGVVTICY